MVGCRGRARNKFSQQTPARASSSRVAPISNLVSTAGGSSSRRRNALADATNFASHFGANILDVEAQVACHDKPNFSPQVLRSSELAFGNFVQHLAVRELQRQGLSDLGPEQVATAADAIQTQIQSRELSEPLATIVNDRDIWVSYLHIYAMTGRGQINNITIEHTSIRNRYPSAAAAAADDDDHGEVDGTDEPVSGHVADAVQPPASFDSMDASASSVAVAAADDLPQTPAAAAAASTVPSLAIDPRLLDEPSASDGNRLEASPAPESIDPSGPLEEELG
ncbi:hypothetical protein PaG_05498 [Moesziomyces aphidis]|uniref:Uncharacterized protein n=1 Tax=Moesziomyces aphidis TaxID=84754 RepID=W3VFW6_MOEAP|nr:hypothetical protein PaG_05498 [Moesziomyces aphidis]